MSLLAKCKLVASEKLHSAAYMVCVIFVSMLSSLRLVCKVQMQM